MSIDVVIQNYNRRLTEGQERFGHGGQQRGAAGKLFEDLFNDLIDCTSLSIAKDKYVRSREINGLTIDNLQVDKHLVKDDQLVIVGECKAYLDVSMLKRAVMDFYSIVRSPDAANLRKVCVLAGQLCGSASSRQYYIELCQELTGLTPEIFTVCSTKQRDGKIQLHDPAFQDNFSLDVDELQRFISWIDA